VLDWVEVAYDGDTWEVAPNYIPFLAIGDGLPTAQAHGCELPTPGLVDAIWRAADTRVDAITMRRTFRLWTDAEMSSPAVLKDQTERIERSTRVAALRHPPGLVAGTFKDIVRLGAQVGIYGWHRLDGSVLQPFYAHHAPSWRDYSQGLRLVRLKKPSA
jgi:hypothetical protein